MEYVCPLYQAASLLADEDLQDGFLSDFEDVQNNGERVYSELNTGDWWRDSEREKPQVPHVFSMLFFNVYL